MKEKSKFPFCYNSDCRGDSTFFPVINGIECNQPQIPVTLPTYDELVGRNGITNDNYNEHILSLFAPDKLNVLTIHAEVEGIIYKKMFEDFLSGAFAKGIIFVPLGSMLKDYPPLVRAKIIEREIMGREGWISSQSNVCKE